MDISTFEKRKKDHIELSMKPENQAFGLSGLESVDLIHEALPDLNFSQITLKTDILKNKLETPLYISSMTAGHKGAIELNAMMAEVCEKRGWMMGVGSQRRELEDSNGGSEWKTLRKKAPKAIIIGNIGIAQAIQSDVSAIQRLVDSIEAQGLFIHLNALQECLQPEGTPQFAGGLKAIERIVKKIKVPVIIKETGCGFSLKTLKNLKNTGIYAVDMSGLGGTHWGRIEGDRAKDNSNQERAAKTFQNWGIGTVQSMSYGIKIQSHGIKLQGNGIKNNGKATKGSYNLWASGGVRTGLDAAKLLAMGAEAVGFAKPAMEQALFGKNSLFEWMDRIEYELKVAMFCTGSGNIKQLKKAEWTYKTT